MSESQVVNVQILSHSYHSNVSLSAVPHISLKGYVMHVGGQVCATQNGAL